MALGEDLWIDTIVLNAERLPFGIRSVGGFLVIGLVRNVKIINASASGGVGRGNYKFH